MIGKPQKRLNTHWCDTNTDQGHISDLKMDQKNVVVALTSKVWVKEEGKWSVGDIALAVEEKEND